MHRFQARPMFVLFFASLIFILSGSAAPVWGESAEIGKGQSEKYGNGEFVAFTLNQDNTAYGVSRGATKDEANERAEKNCTGSGCGSGMRGVFNPGCLAMMKTHDNKYYDYWKMGSFTLDKALKKCEEENGGPCQMEVFLCSN